MCRVRLAIEPDDFDDAHLQRFVQTRDLVVHRQNVLHCLRHRAVGKEDEGVPLAGGVGFRDKERVDQLGCIRNEVFKFAVYCIDRKYRVLANVGMAMFEARADDWNERFKELSVLVDLLEETQSGATNVLVWVLLRQYFGQQGYFSK